MDDYLFFLLQSGGSDSPGRRGMTKGYVAPRQAWRRFARPSGLRDGTVVSVSRRHRRAGLLISTTSRSQRDRVLGATPPVSMAWADGMAAASARATTSFILDVYLVGNRRT